MSRRDPYHDRKVYHFASQINSRGGVSALCFARPRPINLKVAMWTNRREAVTCRKCRTLLAEQQQGWRPIEMAPKDGTPILVTEPKNDGQRRIVSFLKQWGWLSIPGRIQVRPTHWMPLPPVPVNGKWRARVVAVT